MKIDTLITIGFIIYIIVSIKKAMSAGNKKGGTAKPSGWKQKLKDMADQIKEEIEKANMDTQQKQQRKQQPKPPVVTRPSTQQDQGNEEEGYWDYEEEPEEEEELELPLPHAVLKESVLYETRTHSDVGVDIPEESHRNVKKPSRPAAVSQIKHQRAHGRFGRVGKRRLRHAVIWSEIIDKPLAMRK